VVVCVSTLGVVVPPSLVLILLGDAMMRAHTEAANVAGLAGRIVNTQDIFHAALVPAALLLVLTLAIVAFQGRADAGAAREEALRSSEGRDGPLATLLICPCRGGGARHLYAVEAAAAGVALMIHGLATRTVDRETLTQWRETMAITRFRAPSRRPSSPWCSAPSAPTGGSRQPSRSSAPDRCRRSPARSRCLRYARWCWTPSR
jgi:hypothetical protein